MGTGVSVAKEASTVVLQNDNVESIINSILWGRNIYANTRKFVQYQMTCNFSTLTIVFIGAIFRGATIFSVVQLLWINMIMDILAAIALAAEKPKRNIINDDPIRQHDKIVTQPMWRQIIGINIYISFVMFIMFWFNEDIWGFSYNMTDGWMVGLKPSNKTKAFTMLFNMFIYMHLINLINCREVKPTRRNVFSEITKNWFFILTFLGIGIV
jgi:Ca2+-transporting ATPase